MSLTASLYRARVHYRPEDALHTATSGRIEGLDELYLHLESEGVTVGLGEVRENIEYLSGVPAAASRAAVLELLELLDLGAPPEQILQALPEHSGDLPAIAPTLVDIALHDMIARTARRPLVEVLGGSFEPSVRSNHCVFWGSDSALEERARRLVAEGFAPIKLRVAIEGFDRDLLRFERLREICGPGVPLAVDANGSWSYEEARANIRALDAFDLASVEQPLPADALDGMAALAREVGVRVVLDESAASLADVSRIAALGAPLHAHLKLVKIGGIGPMMSAIGQLRRAGVGVMVGQMNEGAAATAAAVHCAMVAGAPYGELYGAHGLIDDPVAGIVYAGGRVQVPRGPGIGVDLATTGLELLWRRRYSRR